MPGPSCTENRWMWVMIPVALRIEAFMARSSVENGCEESAVRRVGHFRGEWKAGIEGETWNSPAFENFTR
jgi:hypothetical protein